MGVMSLDEVDLRSLLRLEADLSAETLEKFLETISRHYGLSGLVYFCASFRGCSLTDPFVLRTQGAAWAEAYKAEGALDEPTIQMGARSIAPVDWARIPRLSKEGNIRLGARRQASDERQGLTIPIRGPANSNWAFLLAVSNETDAEWAESRRERMTDLVHVAYYVHRRVCELYAQDAPTDLNTITKRESEALEWAAEGKTVEDIAILMRISAETVKAHLDSARYKLGALTRAHAVAKAIRAGLVH